jgi:hypothetical protein
VKITVDNDAGRALLALRAGEMTSGAITERIGNGGVVSALARAGLVEGDFDGWRLTAAGRAACPLRNPLAATVLKPPPPALTTNHPWRTLPPRLMPSIKEIAMPESKTAETIAQATARLAAANATTETAQAAAPTASAPAVQDAATIVLGILASATGGLKRGVLIRRSGLQEGTVDSAISRLVKRGQAERAQYGVIRLVGGASAAAAVPAAAPAPVAPKIEKPQALALAPAPANPAFDFALHDDGRLAISAGDDVLVLQRNDTYRLARFLGLFDVDVVAQSQAA